MSEGGPGTSKPDEGITILEVPEADGIISSPPPDPEAEARSHDTLPYTEDIPIISPYLGIRGLPRPLSRNCQFRRRLFHPKRMDPNNTRMWWIQKMLNSACHTQTQPRKQKK